MGIDQARIIRGRAHRLLFSSLSAAKEEVVECYRALVAKRRDSSPVAHLMCTQSGVSRVIRPSLDAGTVLCIERFEELDDKS